MGAVRGKYFGKPQKFFLLMLIERRRRLGKQVVPNFFNKPSGEAVAGTMNQAESVCCNWINYRRAQSERGSASKLTGDENFTEWPVAG